MKTVEKMQVKGKAGKSAQPPSSHTVVQAKIMELYDALFDHAGYGSMKIEMRFLRKGQKEIIVSCGKDFRYVVDWPEPTFCRFCGDSHCTLSDDQEG